MIEAINGFRLVTVNHMTVDGEPYRVQRSWRERLLSRPWRPWISGRMVTPQVPNPNVFIDGPSRLIYGHPATIDQLKQAAAAKGGGR